PNEFRRDRRHFDGRRSGLRALVLSMVSQRDAGAGQCDQFLAVQIESPESRYGILSGGGEQQLWRGHERRGYSNRANPSLDYPAAGQLDGYSGRNRNVQCGGQWRYSSELSMVFVWNQCPEP